MDGALLERNPCWLGLFTGRGAHSAGACCTLCVEAEFRYRGQPRHHARICPLNRQGTAAAAHPHACFSKGCSCTASRTPLQRLWGNEAHTYRLARTYVHTNARIHIHTRMRMRTHTYKHKRARILTGLHTLIHMHTHKHTDTDTCTHTHTNAQTHRHTHAHTRTHIHTHAYACTCCARDGLCQISSVASDAPTLVFLTFLNQ